MNPSDFESLVRRLSRIKWQTDGGSENVGGSQIDGVYRTDECIHLVEATIERDMKKVREDINKLVAAKREEEKTAFLVACWMVMLSEPTPDQRALAHSSHVKLVSIDEFLDPIVSKTEYSYLRPKYFFGSVADPAGKLSATDIERFPTPMSSRAAGGAVTAEMLADRVSRGEIVVLLGDFGAGKSLTMREVYRILDKKMTASIPAFPIAVNLREHWGQVSGTELFTRHAERIGSENGMKFYRAWREGFVTLLLDGFDELAPQPWAYDRSTLQSIRKRATAAIRHLMESRPPKAGVLISGRSHYFATEEELCEALGLSPGKTLLVDLRELTDAEAGEFLARAGAKVPVSRWLPKRPLLLSYLARMGYTDAFSGAADEQDIGAAWVRVIEMVCERESQVAVATHKQTIVDILCRLAHDMRARIDNFGPITDQDLEQAFRRATGHQPDVDAWAILQRLPGVTFRSEGQKWFVDVEWADALGGLALSYIILGSLQSMSDAPACYHPLGFLGRLVAASQLKLEKKMGKDLVSWAHSAVRESIDPTLIADVAAICELLSEPEVNFRDLVIKGAYCGQFDLTDTSLSHLVFEDCFFNLLSVSEQNPSEVFVKGGMIEVLDGVSRREFAPDWIDGNCDVDSFRFPSTNAEVLNSQLPEPVKFGMVILRKLYLQAGRGRKMSALLRGMQSDKVPLVQTTIKTLERLGLLYTRGSDPIAHAVRARAPEVRQLLSRTPDPKEGIWKDLISAK